MGVTFSCDAVVIRMRKEYNNYFQISVADPCLLQPILAMERDRLVVNLHPTIPLLIRESKCMAKMDIEIPIVACTLLFRQDYFDTISDSLNVSVHLEIRTTREKPPPSLSCCFTWRGWMDGWMD